MITGVSFTVQDIKKCLSEGQILESVSLLALTHNSTVFDVALVGKEVPKRMAIKIYNQQNAPPPILAHLLNRTHKHLVNILRIAHTHPAYVCMQLCQQDLKDFMKNPPQIVLPPEEMVRVAREVVSGLLDLKALKLMHGDLKPENILLDFQGAIKIGDLDFLLREQEFTMKKIRVGTLQYMAPEILASWTCSYASDIWSLGMVLFQLYFGRHPFPQLEELDSSQEGAITSALTIIRDQLDRTREHIKASLRECISPASQLLLEAMLSCLVWVVSSRASLQDIAGLLQGVQSRRKGSQSTDYSAMHSEDDIFMFPNSGLLLAFQKLHTILSSLPEEANKFAEILQTIAGFTEKEEESRRKMGSEGLQALRSALVGKYKKMERNFRRLSNLEGGVGYSNKGQLFIHLKYLLDLIEQTIGEEAQQQQWLKDNCTRSAEFLT